MFLAALGGRIARAQRERSGDHDADTTSEDDADPTAEYDADPPRDRVSPTSSQ
jgi:hypothetical protein